MLLTTHRRKEIPLRNYRNTCTYTDMGTRTISIIDDAYEKLSRLKSPSNMSFSEVILKYTPLKKKFSEILREFGPNPTLADSVAEASRRLSAGAPEQESRSPGCGRSERGRKFLFDPVFGSFPLRSVG